ncbi:MAG: single-stranded-DNA-specific exonuclease RecJ [Solirubrobacterales bacterium]
MPKPLKAYEVEPYSYAEARALSEDLGLSEPVAITLVRRGYRTAEAARSFLRADETHEPHRFAAMEEVTARLLEAVGEGRRITVHGDFDTDGVCATAICVAALRDLGASCDWLIPDRLSEGYGLSGSSIERLADRGTELVLTVDCAITATEEVRRARELGIEAIVTDHHAPGEELPDCPVLHPALGGYPFAELCGTAVAWKLTQALREAAGQGPDPAESDLDLVALATVADVVPLVGENRALVRRGLEVARRARRPGLRALMASAGCEPTRLDESDLAFRLAPRINAAGRLYRADAGVELFLTAEGERAAAIASELEQANRERRETEREVEAAALAALRRLPGSGEEDAAVVVGGRGWHPGVIGIVASRLVERTGRPAIVISLDEEGSGRGSGRSVPGFDLLAGLRACSRWLGAFGGHAAAAGLELHESDLDSFRAAFSERAREQLGGGPPARTERIDAVVGGDRIGLALAEELERLGPFGAGNPAVNLLVPSARVSDVREMGEGRHSRFSLLSGSHRALAVAFGRSSISVAPDEQIDASVHLEVNQWNGSVEPRLVLRELYPLSGAKGGEEGPDHGCAGPPVGEWWRRFDAAMEAPAGSVPSDEMPAGSVPSDEMPAGPAPSDEMPAGPAPSRAVAGRGAGGPSRKAVNRKGGSPASVVAELVSSGAGVLVLSADASRRAGLAGGAAGLARFAAAGPQLACGRCALERIEAVAAGPGEGLALSDYAALALVPGMAAAYEHVVLVDPPPGPASMRAAGECLDGSGFLHAVWGEAEVRFALAVLDEQLGLREPLRALFRDLRDGAPAGEEELIARLRGSGPHPRSPELAGRCARVLAELGLVRIGREAGRRRLGALSSEGTELERSAAFRACQARHAEVKRYLESLRQP